jgi:hypothetical protein
MLPRSAFRILVDPKLVGQPVGKFFWSFQEWQRVAPLFAPDTKGARRRRRFLYIQGY